MNRLREVRKKHGYTLKELSLITGCSIGVISMLERKHKPRPNVITLEKIAKAYNTNIVNIYYIIYGGK